MPYTFKQIAGMSVDQISNLASRGDTYREFCAAVKKAAKAAGAVSDPAPEQTGLIDASIQMAKNICEKLVGNQYHDADVAKIAAYIHNCARQGGMAAAMAALSPSTQHVEADVLGGIRICPERDGPCPHGMECPFNGDRYGCDMVGSRAARGTTPSVDESGKGSALKFIDPAAAVTCPDCGGTGDEGRNPSYGPCAMCAGKGKVTLPTPENNHG